MNSQASANVDTAARELLEAVAPPVCDRCGEADGDPCSDGGRATYALRFAPCGCLFLLCDEHSENERQGQRFIEDNPEARGKRDTRLHIFCVAHEPPVVVDRWTWTRL